jgi:hypothetical protein
MCYNERYLIAEFYLVDRGLRHRLPGFSSLGRLVVLTQGLMRLVGRPSVGAILRS